MRYVENLPSKQVAERLGKTDAAVRVMLTRSLKRPFPEKYRRLLGAFVDSCISSEEPAI